MATGTRPQIGSADNKERCGIKGKHTKVFHSFRHNFIGHLLDEGVAEHLVARLVGHEADFITGKVYWNASDARKRQTTIEKFKLPGDVMRLIPRFEEIKLVPRRGKKAA